MNPEAGLPERPDLPRVWLDPRRYRFRFRIALPCTQRSLEVGVRRVLELARASGCGESGRTDLAIAVREALANAMIHGSGRNPENRVLLRSYGEPDGGVLVVVRDQGAGFDPNDVPDPRQADRMSLHHGRGLLLMRELSDHVEFRKGGREVLLFMACR